MNRDTDFADLTPDDEEYGEIVITLKRIDDYKRQQGLKKVLNSRYLWGFGAGAVIANSFFGWNKGYAVTGITGFTTALIAISGLYFVFMLVCAEMSAALPYAGGTYAFARRALGRTGGFLAGLASIQQLIFAAAVITYSMGEYINFLFPGVSTVAIALIPLGALALIQIVGVRESSRLQLIMTGCAISGFVLYFMGGYQGYHIIFKISPLQVGDLPGVFLALPFILWLFAGSGGVAMSAEETKEPVTGAKIGFLTTAVTVLSVVAGMWIFSAGSPVSRTALVGSEYPLLLVLGIFQKSDKTLLNVFMLLGIIAYFASLNSIIHACSRQVFALSRAGYLPFSFREISYHWRTPYQAITLVCLMVMILFFIVNGKLGIVMTAISSNIVYLISLVSFLKIRLEKGDTGSSKASWVHLAASVAGIVISVVGLAGFGMFYLKPLLATLVLDGLGIIVFLAVLKNNIFDDAPEEYVAESTFLQRKVTINNGSGR